MRYPIWIPCSHATTKTAITSSPSNAAEAKDTCRHRRAARTFRLAKPRTNSPKEPDTIPFERTDNFRSFTLNLFPGSLFPGPSVGVASDDFDLHSQVTNAGPLPRTYVCPQVSKYVCGPRKKAGSPPPYWMTSASAPASPTETAAPGASGSDLTAAMFFFALAIDVFSLFFRADNRLIGFPKEVSRLP